MDPIDLGPLMHDRGRGPELRGTRITIYDLIPYLESPGYRDETMLEVWPISREQLEALKQYISDHREKAMAKNAEIDARHARQRAEQNTPEFQARFAGSRERLMIFKEVIDEDRLENHGVVPNSKEARERRWKEFRSRVAAKQSLVK